MGCYPTRGNASLTTQIVQLGIIRMALPLLGELSVDLDFFPDVIVVELDFRKAFNYCNDAVKASTMNVFSIFQKYYAGCQPFIFIYVINDGCSYEVN